MSEGAYVLLGTVLGGCIGIAVEVVRSRNERRQRLLDERRRVYARLLAVAGRLTYEVRMLARRLPEPSEPFSASEIPLSGLLPTGEVDRSSMDLAELPEGPVRDTANRYLRLFDDFREVYEEVRLLSDDQVGEAASRVFSALSNLGRAARSSMATREESMGQALRTMSKARTQLREVMRADLRR
jgi:hypothetical protein